LTLDPISYEVKKGEREINFSKKEYVLLEYLMRHSGKIISKEQIMNGVWNYDADILPNTVEVYIGYLRNKIGKEIIQTIRGFGYKIEKE
jgi:DNA-binding response OmpR family regulator